MAENTTYTPTSESDLTQLLTNATQEERDALADLLSADLYKPKSVASKQAKQLTDELWWKYQTPLGFMVRTPSFDSICKHIARTMLKDDDREQFEKRLESDPATTSWTMLEVVYEVLLRQILDELSEDDKRKFAEELADHMGNPELKEKLYHSFNGFCATSAGSGAFFLLLKKYGGFSTYKFALIITNQVAKAMLGRGLSLGANAALTRGISIFLGPVGWLLLIWGINGLFGTNYKRVVPACLLIYSINIRQDQTA